MALNVIKFFFFFRNIDTLPSVIHGKKEGQGTDTFPGDEWGQQTNMSNVPLQQFPEEKVLEFDMRIKMTNS